MTPLVFFAAAFVLAAAPGPGVVYIVARTLAQGRRSGLVSVAGVAAGNFGNAVFASIGLAAVFALFSAAYTVVKLAGAAYLVFLGLQLLRRRNGTGHDGSSIADGKASRVFRQAFVVALLNPKTTLFFAAFLPQFMDPLLPALPQALAYGAAFVLVAIGTDCCYVVAAAALAPWLMRSRLGGVAGRYAGAAALLGLGLLAATTSVKPAR